MKYGRTGSKQALGWVSWLGYVALVLLFLLSSSCCNNKISSETSAAQIVPTPSSTSPPAPSGTAPKPKNPSSAWLKDCLEGRGDCKKIESGSKNRKKREDVTWSTSTCEPEDLAEAQSFHLDALSSTDPFEKSANYVLACRYGLLDDCRTAAVALVEALETTKSMGSYQIFAWTLDHDVHCRCMSGNQNYCPVAKQVRNVLKENVNWKEIAQGMASFGCGGEKVCIEEKQSTILLALHHGAEPASAHTVHQRSATAATKPPSPAPANDPPRAPIVPAASLMPCDELAGYIKKFGPTPGGNQILEAQIKLARMAGTRVRARCGENFLPPDVQD